MGALLLAKWGVSDHKAGATQKFAWVCLQGALLMTGCSVSDCSRVAGTEAGTEQEREQGRYECLQSAGRIQYVYDLA